MSQCHSVTGNKMFNMNKNIFCCNLWPAQCTIRANIFSTFCFFFIFMVQLPSKGSDFFVVENSSHINSRLRPITWSHWYIALFCVFVFVIQMLYFLYFPLLSHAGSLTQARTGWNTPPKPPTLRCHRGQGGFWIQHLAPLWCRPRTVVTASQLLEGNLELPSTKKSKRGPRSIFLVACTDLRGWKG